VRPTVAEQAHALITGKIVVIAGPPAAGKGTQCDRIKEKYGYVHVSTGDILRANVKDGTELGRRAKEYMDAGQLVPSDLIVGIVKQRLAAPDVAEHGCLLDGFPRAADQASAMIEAGIKVEKFIVISVPDATLVERGCGRRLDPETGAIYHLKFKPPPADVVSRLVHRSDDKEEAIRQRLSTYHAQMKTILPFFREVVCTVDGTGSPDQVFRFIQKELDPGYSNEVENQTSLPLTSLPQNSPMVPGVSYKADSLQGSRASSLPESGQLTPGIRSLNKSGLQSLTPARPISIREAPPRDTTVQDAAQQARDKAAAERAARMAGIQERIAAAEARRKEAEARRQQHVVSA